MRRLVSMCLLWALAASCSADDAAKLDGPAGDHEPMALDSSAQTPPAPPPIESFVRQIYIHGLPYEDATRYDASAVPVLRRILGSAEEQPYWSNAILMLGIVGDRDQADFIIEFMREGEGPLSREQYAAKSGAALTALAYLVNRTGSPRALDYLIQGCDSDVWRERVQWESPFQPDVDDRNLQLTQLGLMALGVSGHSKAGEALRAFENVAPSELSGVLREAMAIHDFVSKEGLISYYKRQRN